MPAVLANGIQEIHGSQEHLLPKDGLPGGVGEAGALPPRGAVPDITLMIVSRVGAEGRLRSGRKP
jgi:hypothetical protein